MDKNQTIIPLTLVVPSVYTSFLPLFLEKNRMSLKLIQEVIIVSANEDVKSLIADDNISFLYIKKNLGFASTVNAGFRMAKGDWLATANDDTILTTELWRKLLSCADEQTGSMNPVIYKQDGSIESAGIKILDRGKALPLTALQDYNHCYETDATNAAVVVYNRKALEKVGLYDERFGSYLEDIDLSLRLKRADYKNIVVPTAKAIHVGQSTSKRMGRKKRYYDFRNWILVVLKNWGITKIIVNFPSILLERLRNLWGIFKS